MSHALKLESLKNSGIVALDAAGVFAVTQALHTRQNVLHDLAFVERQMLALPHDDLPITYHRAHVPGARIVDQAGSDAVERQMMRPAQINEDDISQFALGEIAPVQRLARRRERLLLWR